MSKLDKIVNICNNLLYNDPIASAALDYLNSRLSTDIQEKFSFGFFPPEDKIKILLSFMAEDELIDDELVYFNTSYKTYYSPLQKHNLILPYRDVYGKIVAIVGRTLLNDEERRNLRIPKYKNTSFKKGKHLFGLYEAKRAILEQNCVYVVEGQFDCIKAHANNICNVVALGSANMTSDQLLLILRYTENIKLLLDNDEPGKLGRDRIVDKYGGYANIYNSYIPSGFKDLDELLSEMNIQNEQELSKALN